MNGRIVCAAVLALAFALGSTDAMPANMQVKDFHPLNVDQRELFTASRKYGQHRSNFHAGPFTLKLAAFSRVFELELEPNAGLFSKDFRAVTITADGEEEISMHDRFYYKGRVVGEDSSFVHLRVHLDGTIHGGMRIGSEHYHVEPAAYHIDNAEDLDHIIYRASDNLPPHHVIDDLKLAIPAVKEDPEYFDKLFHSDSGRPASSRSRRAAFNPAKTACSMKLEADTLFFESVGSSSVAITFDRMVTIFTFGNDIFSSTDFLLGIPEVVLEIGNVAIRQTLPDALRGVTPHDTYLEEYSKIASHENFCLAHVFTYSDFNGILGLAWKGGVSNIGGICQEAFFDTNFGRLMYYNSGFTSGITRGSPLSLTLMSFVFTHEVGHGMGSSHDPTTLSYPNGLFIMYPEADANAQEKFSNFTDGTNDGSVIQMSRNINAHGGCFVIKGGSSCGNAVVESTEFCDCGAAGLTCDDIDICCARNQSCLLRDGKKCSPLNPNSNGCCTDSCAFAANTVECEPASPCQEASKCSGTDLTCVAGSVKADRTLCQSNTLTCGTRACTGMCLGGQCNDTVCTLWNTTECTQNTSPAAPSGSTACKVYCLDKTSGTCKPSSQLGAPVFTTANISTVSDYTPDIVKAPGALCAFDSGNEASGQCSTSGVCVESDADQTLADLINGLNTPSLSETVDWLNGETAGLKRWVWLIIIITVLIIIGVCLGCMYKPRQTPTPPKQPAAAKSGSRAQVHPQGRGNQPRQPANRPQQNRPPQNRPQQNRPQAGAARAVTKF